MACKMRQVSPLNSPILTYCRTWEIYGKEHTRIKTNEKKEEAPELRCHGVRAETRHGIAPLSSATTVMSSFWTPLKERKIDTSAGAEISLCVEEPIWLWCEWGPAQRTIKLNDSWSTLLIGVQIGQMKRNRVSSPRVVGSVPQLKTKYERHHRGTA